ncbi:MAG: DUF2232 domain-containing protein [Pseudobdellovibrionaceae bacterium]
MSIQTQRMQTWKLFAATLVFSLGTLILGAPFIRLFRNMKGSAIFWSLGVLTTGTLWLLNFQALAILFSAIWVTIGLQVEFEIKKWTLWSSGVLATSLGFVFSAFLSVLLLAQKKMLSVDAIKLLFEQFSQQLKQIYPQQGFDTSELLFQTPSVFAVFLIITLAMGLVFEKRVLLYFSNTQNLESSFKKAIAQKQKLLGFKIPEYLIWPALLSILLSLPNLANDQVSIAAVNVMNIFVCIFFLQGLAVLESVFLFFRAGFLIRLCVFLFIFSYLFLVISALGLIDYWVDIRNRLKKSSAAKPN